MSQIRVIICDDEPLARDYLRRLLGKEADCEIVAESKDVDEAIAAIETGCPDVVFLDIQMPGQSGLEVIEEIGVDDMPYTIFVTAHDRYAIPAFERHALDYLLKPFTEERFRQTMRRVREQLALRRNAQWAIKVRSVLADTSQPPAAAPSQPAADIIPVRVGGRTVLVRTAELGWIESADCYVTLHRGKERFLHREALSSLQDRLDPRKFIRIHRGAIANVDYVQELRTDASGVTYAILRDGTSLRLSRRRKRDVEIALGGR